MGYVNGDDRFQAALLPSVIDDYVDANAPVRVIDAFVEEYAAHCRQADIISASLRDCLSYYNGHGDAEPGSLAYYGGGRWHKYRLAAQDTLKPYCFGPATSD